MLFLTIVVKEKSMQIYNIFSTNYRYKDMLLSSFPLQWLFGHIRRLNILHLSRRFVSEGSKPCRHTDHQAVQIASQVISNNRRKISGQQVPAVSHKEFPTAGCIII